MIAAQAPTLRYRLEQDTDASDPRQEWDHFATMVCNQRWHELGDRGPEDNELEAYRRGGLPLLSRYLRRYEGAVAVRMLGLLDHSGLHMYLGGGENRFDPGGWDSGTVGFIYVTREQLKAAGFEPGDKVDGEDAAEMIIRQEVEEYDQYLTGDVYGYIIETIPECDDEDCCLDSGEPNDSRVPHRYGCSCACHEEGEHVESCWGFYGHEYAEQEAKDALKAAQEQASADFEKYAITC